MKIGSIEVFAGKDEQSAFMENFSMLLSAGVDINTALKTVNKEIHSSSMKVSITRAQKEIEAGSPAWKALQKNKLLPNDLVTLVKIGEQTGNLSENLKIIKIAQDKDRALKSKLVSAMIYPMIVFGLTILVGFGVTIFLLPRLSPLLSQLNVKLPLVTRIFIGAGNFISKYGIVAVPSIIIVSIVIVYFLFFSAKTKNIGIEFLFKIPGIRKLMQEVQLARMGYLLGTMINAGLPVEASFDSMAQVATYDRFKKFFAHISRSLDRGNSFEKSFKSYRRSHKLIPYPIQQLIVAGGQTGKTGDILLRIGEVYEERSDTTSKNLITAVEPILLLFVWVCVLSLALAVILPIYSLVGGVSR
jgi:type IV pilus assembly protein PilC